MIFLFFIISSLIIEITANQTDTVTISTLNNKRELSEEVNELTCMKVVKVKDRIINLVKANESFIAYLNDVPYKYQDYPLTGIDVLKQTLDGNSYYVGGNYIGKDEPIETVRVTTMDPKDPYKISIWYPSEKVKHLSQQELCLFQFNSNSDYALMILNPPKFNFIFWTN